MYCTIDLAGVYIHIFTSRAEYIFLIICICTILYPLNLDSIDLCFESVTQFAGWYRLEMSVDGWLIGCINDLVDSDLSLHIFTMAPDIEIYRKQLDPI